MHIRNILTRHCVLLDEFEAAVELYETLLGQKARLRFDHPTVGLRLAQVANVLLLGGSEEALAPFRETRATFLVQDIEAYEEYLPKAGCTVVRPLQNVPTGWNMLVRHPDGMLVEYVEHATPHPDDEMLGLGAAHQEPPGERG